MRIVVIWCVLLVLAVINGTVREFVLVPRVGGAAAHVISCFALSALILLLTWLTIRWLRPANDRHAIAIGTSWLAMTLMFEFGFGRLRGVAWDVLLADYNVLNGRLWVLVLLTTFLAPLVAARMRGLFALPAVRP